MNGRILHQIKDQYKKIILNADGMAPQVGWGTSPGMVSGIDSKVPDKDIEDSVKRKSTEDALNYMGLKPNY